MQVPHLGGAVSVLRGYVTEDTGAPGGDLHASAPRNLPPHKAVLHRNRNSTDTLPLSLSADTSAPRFISGSHCVSQPSLTWKPLKCCCRGAAGQNAASHPTPSPGVEDTGESQEARALNTKWSAEQFPVLCLQMLVLVCLLKCIYLRQKVMY